MTLGRPASRWRSVGWRENSPADGGFTLIEVLVAFLIFILVSTASISVLITALRTVRENNDRVQAANVARSQIEALRFAGTTRIPVGLSLGGPIGTDPSFTVRTTSNWVGLNQPVSPCLAARPGQDYLRVSVDVTSKNLTGSQVIDTVIVPDSSQTVDGTGTAAVSVIDQMGLPVSDVVIRATDIAHPTNAFTLTTGADGCLFLPNLLPTGSLLVSVARTLYVPPTPSGATQTLTIVMSDVTRASFLLAEQATLAFKPTDPTYPLPPLLPVTWQENSTGASLNVTTSSAVRTGLWPSTSGFGAWLGMCADSSPSTYGAVRDSFTFTAGATTTASLAAAPVKLRGLPKDVTVVATYAGADVLCAGKSFEVGKSDALGIIRITMPYGNWSFSTQGVTPGQTQLLLNPLVPTADGTPLTELIVNFTLAGLDIATASPSGTSGSTGTPTPSASAS